MNIKLFIKGITLITLTIAVILPNVLLSSENYDRKSNKENRVRVDVLPVQLQFNKTIRFDVKMNTHSVKLDNNFLVDSLLIDSEGIEYKPLKWEGTPPGSHHRSGMLEFPSLTGKPESVTLIIKNVSNVPKRIYQWKIK